MEEIGIQFLEEIRKHAWICTLSLIPCHDMYQDGKATWGNKKAANKQNRYKKTSLNNQLYKEIIGEIRGEPIIFAVHAT